MPLIGAAIMMDTDRIIPQTGSSPGSNQSSNGGGPAGGSGQMPGLSSVGTPNHHQTPTNGAPMQGYNGGGQYNGMVNGNTGHYSAPAGSNPVRVKKKGDRTVAPPPPPTQHLLTNSYANTPVSNNTPLQQHLIQNNPQQQMLSPSNGGVMQQQYQPHQYNSYAPQDLNGGLRNAVGSGGITNHGYARDALGLHTSQVQGPGGANGSSQAQQATRLNTTADTTVSMQEDSDELQEVIEVQILPQDENWGESATAVTANSEVDYGGLANNTSVGSVGLLDTSGAGGGGHNTNPSGFQPNAGPGAGGIGNPDALDAAGGGGGVKGWQGGGGSLETDRGMGFRCRRHAGPLVAGLLSMMALVSPILMVALPKLHLFSGRLHSVHLSMKCGIECDGMLVTLAFKLFTLAVGTWGVFYRRPRATLPRIQVYRTLVCLLILVFLISYWLFFASHILQEGSSSVESRRVEYRSLVQYALNLVDALLFVHYLAIVLMELRHRQSQYYVKVVRSPDGESRGFPIGAMSVQRAAATVLDQYYTAFPIYNPFLDRMNGGTPIAGSAGASGMQGGVRQRGPGSQVGKTGIKVYDVDGPNDGNSTVVSVASKKGFSSHNERFYEEYEYEKKLKKRRARLVTATEEAFTHIRRMQENQLVNDKNPMESYEAAQSIFPTISRPLQKYLRVTRQQPRHTMESILQHLSLCLSYDMSPRAFLEKFLVTEPVLQNDREVRDVQSWALVSERLLYRDIQPGTIFQLRQGDVSLLCSVQKLPHFNVAEEIIDPNSNRFVLRLNSETSV